jgi:thiol-disulfide isomerase/thioredoxin
MWKGDLQMDRIHPELGVHLHLSLLLACMISLLPYDLRGRTCCARESDRLTAEAILKFLDATRLDREAASRRDSLLGQQAPPLTPQKWLIKRTDESKWPPGKITVLRFWSIRCASCVRELPEINQLADWIEHHGGTFLSIHSAEAEPAGVLALLKNHHVEYALALDRQTDQDNCWNSKTFAAYGVDVLPSYIIIGASGRILSYRRPSVELIERCMREESVLDHPSEDIRGAIIVRPNGWFATDVEPGSPQERRFSVYRPDTPDFVLKDNPDENRLPAVEIRRNVAKEQCVYEVILRTVAPKWGTTLTGDIVLMGHHSDRYERVRIPYSLKSKSMVSCAPATVYFGVTRYTETVTQQVTLSPQEPCKDVTIEVLSVSDDMAVKTETRGSTVMLHLAYTPKRSGFCEGTVTLLATDAKENRQTIDLTYSAFVRE